MDYSREDLKVADEFRKPNTKVYYELQEIGTPNLGEIVSQFGKEHNLPMR